jgi:hypothetical protein
MPQTLIESKFFTQDVFLSSSNQRRLRVCIGYNGAFDWKLGVDFLFKYGEGFVKLLCFWNGEVL